MGGKTNVKVLGRPTQPTGTFFLRSMDRDPDSRPFLRCEMRRRSDRSLPNTTLSLHYDEPSRSQSRQLGERRRFFKQPTESPFSPARAQPERRLLRRGSPKCYASSLDSALCVSRDSSPFRSSIRRCRKPPFNDRSASEPRPSRVPLSGGRGQLNLGDLVPMPKPPKQRLIPPPMEKKPLRTARRRTPLPLSQTTPERRRGVKMFDANEYQNAFDGGQTASLLFNRTPSDVPTAHQRTPSNISARSSASVRSDTSEAGVAGQARGRDSPSTARNSVTRRARSMTPTRRNYDIITGLPL
ncbi:uncharacterized protein TEOVI_000675300 [Trypanosoma equiperdum]|uniref:Uncharacterized protein n=2 Tax=Trypanozoon TaxID=39700 RepID=Q584X6_TRYB2|nr:hypothetical protein, conserved [Trypanosoma brucei brucei TREU927]AAX79946.1 hypothetical protein, conserved [Trypanosoma brucei]AAZ11895.1 hypothetical protein, conserved [Trypanosoma brucei brucei TREU927]SCU67632.1 hypothetical protein, conserved [Trypanosoma equiperdum]